MDRAYNLPADTVASIRDHIATCKNLALILDRYVPRSVIEDSREKSSWLRELLDGQHIDVSLARSVYQRWHTMLSALNATLFPATLDWRMLVGSGGASVLETDLTLHHLYSLPYIPASALKGLTRAYLTGEVEGYKSSRIDTDNGEIKRIFGSQEQAGTVIFFDAMPEDGKFTLALDILNPHYPDYYGASKPPTNDQKPIPVTFLTVTATTFMFALTSRDVHNKQHLNDVQSVRTWLLEALQAYGVGGKTSAGYGYFTDPSSMTKHK